MTIARKAKAVAIATAVTVSAGVAAFAATATTQYSGSEGAIGFNNSSATGSAIEGTVSPAGNASFKIPFGILGAYEPSSSGTFGVGVAAVSTSGYGIYAKASGANPAMIAIASGTGGAMEVDSPGAALTVNTATGPGMTVSVTGSAPGVIAETTYQYASGQPIYAEGGTDAGYFQSLAKSGNTHVGGTAYLGVNASGIGAAAFGNANTSGHPALMATSVNTGDVFRAYNYGDGMAFVISGSTANASGHAGAGSDVNIRGDVFLHGAFFTCAGSCTELTPSGASEEIATRAGRVRAYRAAQTEPTLEATGEGRMSAGIGYVRLDSAYAKAISPGAGYLVFVTPEGDTRGLYVSDRSSAGFGVREHGGGRSNVAFTYRIVAQPAAHQAIHSPLDGRAAATIVRPRVR
jgi:hypothetical protein